MCQLCSIDEIAARERWPTPLEHQKSDINFLVKFAHDRYEEYRKQKEAQNDSSRGSESLHEPLRLLVETIEQLQKERQAWWSSPQKRELRRRLEEECDQGKLSELHKINNSTTERIEAMDAKLGQFLKWTLGMNGGKWELMQGVKVAKAER